MSRKVNHETALLVDTNTIIESHRTVSWQALADSATLLRVLDKAPETALRVLT